MSHHFPFNAARHYRIVARLERSIVEARRRYYNSATGRSSLSDAEYDAQLERLRSLHPDHPLLFEVGAPPPAAGARPLAVPMGSLPKLRPRQVAEWLAATSKVGRVRGDGWLSITPKIDGQAVQLHYRNGALLSGATRGDGRTGEALGATHLENLGGMPARAPGIRGNWYVDGELTISRTAFNKLQADPATAIRGNERNRIVGFTNRQTFSNGQLQALRRGFFVAYRLHTPDDPRYAAASKFEQMAQLRSLGFITVEHINAPLSETQAARRAAVARAMYEAQPRFDSETGVHHTAEQAEAQRAVLRKVEARLHAANPQVGQLAVQYRVEDVIDRPSLFVELIEQFGSHYDVLQDGLVIEHNSGKLRAALGTETNGLDLAAARSVKLDVEHQQHLSGVVDRIDFNYTQRRLFRPVLVLREPLVFNRIKVERVTLNNARQMVRNCIVPGMQVQVIRSGDVIPRLMKIHVAGKWRPAVPPGHAEGGQSFALRNSHERASWRSAPKICPHCQTELQRNSTDIYCPNVRCIGSTLAQPVHFFRRMAVDGLGETMLGQLVAAGFNTPAKMLAATPRQLRRLNGWGETSAVAAVDALHTTVNGVPLARIMYACGVFQSVSVGLGETRCQALVDALGAKRILRGQLQLADIDLPGFGPKLRPLIEEGIEAFREFYATIEQYVTLQRKTAAQRRGRLREIVCCFTGFRNAGLVQLIESHGGTCSDTFTARTTVLFAAKASTKTTRAEKAGVPIVWQADALNWVNQQIKAGG